jgi:hypothetical protein
VTHGTRSGYNSGCRCPECTEANTAASRARRERIAEHSTTSIPATRPRPRVEATWAATDDVEDYYPSVPAEPGPFEIYPRANSKDRLALPPGAPRGAARIDVKSPSPQAIQLRPVRLRPVHHPPVRSEDSGAGP